MQQLNCCICAAIYKNLPGFNYKNGETQKIKVLTNFVHKYIITDITRVDNFCDTACGSVWQSAAFGTQKPQVQILSRRLHKD